MLRRLTIAVRLVAGLAAAPALAAERPMSGTEIRTTVAGATIEIDAGLGARVAIRLTTDGEVHGQAGGLAFFLGASADRGRWWISGDRLCHQWSTWFSGAPHCLTLRRDGEMLRWQSDSGRSGTATILVPPPTVVASAPPPRPAPAPSRVATATPAAATASPAPVPELPPALALGSLVPPQPATIRPAARSAVAASAERTVPPQPVPAARPNEKVTAARPITSEPAPATPKPARQLYQVVNVRADDVLNVRAGPSADYDIIARVPPGSRDVEMTGDCLQLWCPVRHRGASGWVNRFYLAAIDIETGDVPSLRPGALSRRDEPDAPRSCLSTSARGLLDRIEAKFGPVRVISTCRPGATIAGTNRVSRHASGNAIDFDAGPRKAEIITWLIDNHHDGGTMTYRDMEHIHVDIGPRFVSIAGGMHWASWRDGRQSF